VTDPYNLQRFIDAQEGIFATALAELKAGSKRSHWMWFVFPQIAGLGMSPTSRLYAIASLDEAQAYLNHPRLGARLIECVEAVLPWAVSRNAEEIFGHIDAAKFRSSLTLFEQTGEGGQFAAALDLFFDGKRDNRTLALLNAAR
jgi:uncharacterized protein (DUF1810 family)